jgi:hypothetical protein
MINMKLENYALSLFGNPIMCLNIIDAKESIKCDEAFAKGYFRKGSAHVALAQLDLAVKDFKQVCKMMP